MTAVGSNLVRRYSFREETAFGSDAPVAGDTWTMLPVEGTPEGTRNQEVDAAAVSNPRGNDAEDFPTRKSAEMGGLVCPLYGGNVAFDGASGDSPPTSFYLQKIYENFFGMDALSFAGTTTTSTGVGSVADPLDLTSVTGLVPGMSLQVNGQFRNVASISGNEVVLDEDLSPAPESGDVVYGAWMLKPTVGELASYLYILEELANAERYLYGPGKPTALQINGIAAGNGLKVGFGLSANSWTAPAFAPSAAPANAFTALPPVVASADISVAGVSTCIRDGSVDFGVKSEWRDCATGPEGRDGMEISGSSPVIGVNEYFTAGRLAQFQARTGLNVRMTFTNGATNLAKARHAVNIWMPNAQCNTAGAAAGNLRGMQTTFMGRDPTVAQVAAGLTAPIYLNIYGGRA
jgi:hypothetical protein